MFKDNPDVWHELPTTKKGLMMIPLTQEACERHSKKVFSIITTTTTTIANSTLQCYWKMEKIKRTLWKYSAHLHRTLTNTAQSHGLKAERWTKEDFDLSRPSGCQLAMDRLRHLKPKRLWLSPECGPYSIMQNANQRSPQQAEALRKKRETCLSTLAKLY